MKKEELIAKMNLLGKSVFTIKDLQNAFPEDASHIKTVIKRLKDSGNLFSVCRGLYTLNRGSIDAEKIATAIYTPSYISFESALSKYGVINQGLYQVTLATTRHSKKMVIGRVPCIFSKIAERLFFGFNLLNGVYLAEPEKAVLDILYLKSFGKKEVEFKEWDITALNHKKLTEYSKIFSGATENLVQDLLVG